MSKSGRPGMGFVEDIITAVLLNSFGVTCATGRVKYLSLKYRAIVGGIGESLITSA